ncbi:AAA family ATPase [Paenibacillus sp. SZ31]|uniref:AAA family ATPase n=1 Tax=Paenibacillus sp. SZ31 TaxID=2725555 RepID=UPI00146F3ADE|nr:AAA family ATPase [Paenibacillus sp. SZ31]NMI05450.1 AAA family ATPase [Paenibacillus sp. SZ31]
MYSELQESITRLKITHLFGSENVDIPMDNGIKILMGENGTGKTTILNILYYSLTLNYIKLVKLPFESVEISFGTGESLKIKKSDLNRFFILDNDHFLTHKIYAKLNPQEISRLVILARTQRLSEFKETIEDEFHDFPYPSRLLYSELREMGIKKSDEKLFFAHQEIIKNAIKDEILYFPTYRRIEEDLSNLGISNKTKINDELLIKFGLTDVEKLIEKIKNEINDISIKWFSKVNGEMLSQLITGIEVTEEMRESVRNQETLKIVLGRIGSNLKMKDKEKIYNLVSADDFYLREGHDPLVYFLSNLIKIYDQQKELDNAIKNFADACNEYLKVSKKEFVYDESNVELKLYRKKGNGDREELTLNTLSSGEKQIVSLFSRLYLDPTESKFIIIFDEPELSLSTEWQNRLLPDILKSKKCSFLLAVTHSPFIFENDLDDFARGLEMYIREVD